MRLGIYADLLYRADDGGVSTDRAFILFVAALAERVDELVLFGRLDPQPGRAPYPLPERIRFVALPHYARVSEVVPMLRTLRAAARTFAAAIHSLDLVWIFGPHPVALELARVARRRHVPVVLGIRQDFPGYIRRRLPSRRWLWAVPAAHLLDCTFRLLARRVPTLVVGEDLAARYPDAHVTGISLVRRDAVASAEDALRKDWEGEVRLLSVGRLDEDKNPLLLADIVACLRRNGASWRLLVAGEGALAAAVAERARKLGVDDTLELRGYVRHGQELSDLYRSSHAFLHVSTTNNPIKGGGGTANTAFLASSHNPPDGNARASRVDATFWIETIAGTDGAPDVHQLQYTQLVMLDFNGIHWPHVTVGTLVKQ